MTVTIFKRRNAKPHAAVSLLLLVIAIGAAPTTTPVFHEALAPRDWSFPRDHGRHDGFKIEWWYFTGNLRDAAGKRFGYQLTFFRSAFRPDRADRQSAWAMTDLYFGHAAITNVDGGTFTFRDRLQRDRAGLASASDQTLDVQLLDWSAKLQSSGAIKLHVAERDLAIDLTCVDGRGPVLQGAGGVNPKGHAPGQASYYCSMTRLQTTGTLTTGGASYQVQGLSWMDHEFSSNALGKEQVGWDWMGLHLSDGTDLMIYRLRNSTGGVDYLSGTRITADGQPHYLSDKELSIEGSDTWRSPTSGGVYPQRWTIRRPGVPPLVVRSLLKGQELVTSDSTDVTYFEGAAEVLDERGGRVGEGYLELTGYAKPINGPR